MACVDLEKVPILASVRWGDGGGGQDLQQNRASDSSSCERMRSACLHFV